MRITYIHYLYGDDTALHHVRQFVEAACSLGNEVELLAMNLAPDDKRAHGEPLRQRLRQRLKRHLGRYLHEPKELLWNYRYVRKETRLLRATRPDVLLVRDHVLTASCIFVARRLQLPLVLEMNAPAEESRRHYHQYLHLPWFPEWLEAQKLKCADAITVVSSSLRDHLMARYGTAAGKFTVVPNGADTCLFHPKRPVDDAVRDFVRGAVTVGFVGSFREWHGMDLLAQMITHVAAARPMTRFVLVGDGPGIDGLRQMLLPVRDRVLVVGAVPYERVPALVASFDIGVAAQSDFYMSPLKVVEWMAAGKAVVAPRHQSLSDLIDDGVHGMLFPPGNSEALIRTVLRLVDDAGVRHKLGTRAAERVRRFLTWSENARRVVDVCGRAVAQYTTPRAHAA